MSTAKPEIPASYFGEDQPTNGDFDGLGDISPRCSNVISGRTCNRKLAEFVTRPWQIRCTRCKYLNVQE